MERFRSSALFGGSLVISFSKGRAKTGWKPIDRVRPAENTSTLSDAHQFAQVSSRSGSIPSRLLGQPVNHAERAPATG